jgi:hypothetical protein
MSRASGRKTRTRPAGAAGDFGDVQFVALFIEQDDGGTLDVEQRYHALDGTRQQMVELMDGGGNLDIRPLLEAQHRSDGVSGRGVVALACTACTNARNTRSTAGCSCVWVRAI